MCNANAGKSGCDAGSLSVSNTLFLSLWVKFDPIATREIHGPTVVLGGAAAHSAGFPCTRIPDFQVFDFRPIRSGKRVKARIWP